MRGEDCGCVGPRLEIHSKEWHEHPAAVQFLERLLIDRRQGLPGSAAALHSELGEFVCTERANLAEGIWQAEQLKA
jgi:hypothetical protein